MRLVNCSIVEGGRCLYSGSKFIVLYCAHAVATFRSTNREAFDAISSRCPCSTFQKKNMHKLPNIFDKLLVQEAVKCTT